MDKVSGRAAIAEAALVPTGPEPVPVSAHSGDDQPRGLAGRLKHHRAMAVKASRSDLEAFALSAMQFQYEALTKLEALYLNGDAVVVAQARKAGQSINDIYLAFHAMDDR